jgi:hypothetical protein
MKKCCKCEELKEVCFFGKYNKSKDGLRGECKQCRKKYYSLNKKQIIEKVKDYYIVNKEKISEYQKQYYFINKIKLDNYKNEYIQNNKEKVKNRINEYTVNKRKTNILLKLKHNYRNRTNHAFNKKSYSKNSKTMKMLGCDWEYLKKYIENKFTNGINWDNYGEWHIDHVIPLSSANNEKELIDMCHYTNLQPLWAKENLSKGNKINN